MEQIYLDFISTVSHELRTPLTSIRGYAETLLSASDKLTTEQKEKFLGVIRNQSNRLIRLVENLLAVSRMQTEGSELVLKSANAKDLVKQAIQMVKTQYPAHGFVVFQAPKVHEILVDVDKFQQIMVNLIENAAKYSPEKSKVTVNIDFAGNSLVSIKIADEGIGIKEEDRQKVFEKFSRLDNPLTRKSQGSGLGLYIAKNLTESMNGEIRIKNCDNGCVFEILIPAAGLESHTANKLKKGKNVR